MPHRPSRGAISRVALLAASSRAGKRKQATAGASILSASHAFSSPSPHPITNSLLVGPALRTDDSVRHASVPSGGMAGGHRRSANEVNDFCETINDRRGAVFLNNEERLDRWTEKFEQQFSWPPSLT
ncbi:hypothetical protein T265_05024 [Opisthorchis viverrini]|uniref:Uncharacterized protein n=1 Tax=Opisthorchis viverrini TaxID=6198 RepID=A0A074ZXG5_OPIVI|nr:hypothetical protein T265_05024 [Opisthorchis viverrini]KER28040.1 hypothetical protein T265_05024 [Opisthorchis viverrini]